MNKNSINYWAIFGKTIVGLAIAVGFIRLGYCTADYFTGLSESISYTKDALSSNMIDVNRRMYNLEQKVRALETELKDETAHATHVRAANRPRMCKIIR